MSVTKRSDGRWQGSIELPSIHGKRKRKFVYSDTKKECKQLVNSIEEDVSMNNFSSGSKLTFGAYIGKWLKVDCKQLSPTTKEAYERYVNIHVNPTLKDKILNKILPIDIQELINNFSDNHKLKSCRNLIGILHKAFKDARKNNLIKFNPCEDVTMFTEIRYEYYIYSEKEFNMLLDYVRGTVEELPIVLAALCGLRRGEVMGLTWNDINFETSEITIRQNAVSVGKTIYLKATKTNSSYRKIIAPEYVIQVLQNYKSIGYVYPDKNGNVTNGKYYSNKFRRLLKRAKLPHTRFHDLRHFNATMMLKLGISDKVAASRLGHSDTNMTKKYQHVLESMENNSAKALNSIVQMAVKMAVK